MHLDQALPNLTTGNLSTSGFLFGAGTSAEAGYPMMPDLTRQVVTALGTEERASLDEVLHSVKLPYDSARGEPNFETIADHVTAHAMSTYQPRFWALESRLRKLVTEVILAVESPLLDRHVAFLCALKKRAYGRPASVYIFTTNYDLLFELAGAQAGVVVETGFVGSVERFFDTERFGLSSGMLAKTKFSEHPVLTVRLVKLHGSVSWVSRDGSFFERHPASITAGERRVMILPRRRKVVDSLHAPHNALFTVASSAIGGDCKYLVSCGFSFSDEHITDNLLIPAVNAGRIRLFAFCEAETEGMQQLKTAGAFHAGFKNGGITAGVSNINGTDCWMFSRFVSMF